MLRSSKKLVTVVAVGVSIAMTMGLAAQTGIAQLGLTETAARNFVMSEIKSAATNRRSDIVLTGRRAFLKLPRGARGPAATALFAWAKAYVNSAPFKTAYASFRSDVIGPGERPNQPTIEEEVKKAIDTQTAGLAQLRRAAAGMPPADAANILKSIENQEAQIQSGELAKMLRTGLEADRATKATNDSTAAKQSDERYPADPLKIFARRLHEFLDATSDVNFSARTISLTGGPDGIEFVDKADRARSWIWQEAVIAGPEATAAARSAAESWLKEIER